MSSQIRFLTSLQTYGYWIAGSVENACSSYMHSPHCIVASSTKLAALYSVECVGSEVIEDVGSLVRKRPQQLL